MEYQELFAAYTTLLEENDRLRRENEQLRTQLGISVSASSADFSNATVTQQSATDNKIALFRSLFCGREDVFARRWYSKTSEKSGYQPVCANEWAEGICDKRKFKCSACPNRQLVPLTNKDIYNHLAGKDSYGRDVVGIYPMLLDETCRFLCVDFDDDDYQKAVTAFRSTCEHYNIPVCVERSRSGEGAHAWIFFENPVSAASARKLGSGLLTKAMEHHTSVSFKSYDRLFPNQDTLPKGGFGNLVALPLQGLARKQGNSVFVDETFCPYPDQWAFLSCVRKMATEELESALSTICKAGELGTLVSDSDEKPWETKSKLTLTRFDFPDQLIITRANMLYIPTDALSPLAQNHIKRLAAFKNPDFYRAQAMRLPIYDKPRIICTAEIVDGYIGLPRGCEQALCEMLDAVGTAYSIDDKTNYGDKIPVSFSGALREDQQPAAEALLLHSHGVLSATTAFGKTVIASYLIGARKTNTLILVHTKALMQQWQKALGQFLDVDITPPPKPKGRGRQKAWSPIGMLGAGKDALSGIVDIAVMQSLINGDEVKELVRDYGMIIVDECHHVSAVNFEKILKFANARYVYGLTATPTRQDGHHPIIFMQCGPIRYRVDAKTQAAKQSFAHHLIPRFTSFRSIDRDKDIATLYRDLAENEVRNEYIVNDIITALKQGRCPIVLTERREHVQLLAERLSHHCPNIVTLCGSVSAKERREAMEQLEAIPADEPMLILATGRYVGEGFDYPRLDTLFLALPIAWKGKVAQYAGRLHREYSGKDEVQIYDYVDIHIPVLERMYHKRLKGYAAIGYRVKVDPAPMVTPDLIYDTKNFYPVYCRDLHEAAKEILIVSPFMRKSRITQLKRALDVSLLNGAIITVVTRPPSEYKGKEQETIKCNIEDLTEYGVKVITRTDFHQKFTIVDGQIVWYGSINFLSFGITEESVMRFTNHDIAGQLMDTVI